ncbi:sigma-70 family RNA polymerase sigma factor [Haloechinothrix sp. LS1_15]|uniref:RNA polymerase sigma factor n=1 Tax=Haloechinothrix sp. LS1_15 TaxID=2652248 RepID=UPI002945A093|nr:sigma-70 family RNA polymerase sigma factor [Haloechinothrix sp. LS1_15]MDV6013622.1 sigma-70 family RNA polymerase sigma factor [Haloechinothrix sp. LS1_15]
MTELRTQREAFARYVLPELEILYRVARTLTNQPADAEDLVQDTLVRAYRSIGSFDGQYPRAWLLTILRNTERNRHRRRRPQLLDDPNQDVQQEAAPATREDPERTVMDGQFDAEVERAFRDLPERYREVMALIDIEGLTYAEAAEALGLPTGTVMSRLHRARKRVRAHLSGTGIGVRRGEA